ncbi:MAG: hypothetical protein LLF96_06850, partial [Eubacteriales bacterium]|nr:hypothetical protein [Eubacteriales bacterium]
TLAASVALTYLETGRVATGEKYWFMDERTQPSIFVVLCAIAVMLLARLGFAHRGLRPSATRRWATLGGCAFGVYLLQDLVIAQTRYRFFIPLSGRINPLLAALIWEAGVFAVALGATWALKKLPGLRRLL